MEHARRGGERPPVRIEDFIDSRIQAEPLAQACMSLRRETKRKCVSPAWANHVFREARGREKKRASTPWRSALGRIHHDVADLDGGHGLAMQTNRSRHAAVKRDHALAATNDRTFWLCIRVLPAPLLRRHAMAESMR